LTVRFALTLLVLVGAWLAMTRLNKGETLVPAPAAALNVSIPQERLAVAHLGGGCFWCLEAAFEQLQGVGDVESGYAGGSLQNPTYPQVSTGKTGHAEVVRVPYDKTLLSYDDILDVFFSIHDPTTKDAQGPDHGTQYRSIILVQNDEEAATARGKVAAIAPLWSRPVVTEIVPLQGFWLAEPEHQDYFARNPGAPYCQSIVAPKVTKIRTKYKKMLRTGLEKAQ
jgi:peptide-methionine (S)-S-oxide reductase